MFTRDSAVAAGWEPERGDSRDAPLPTMAVPAEDQVDHMMRLHLIENIRGMRQEERKSMVSRWRDAAEVRAMQ